MVIIYNIDSKYTILTAKPNIYRNFPIYRFKLTSSLDVCFMLANKKPRERLESLYKTATLELLRADHSKAVKESYSIKHLPYLPGSWW